MDVIPSVSVIIPAYNASAYITETLESVFSQTYTDFEVIVINDGSSDTQELERILEGFGKTVRYIHQENRGPSAARNAGIAAARGVFLAFLDSDDTWEPEYLAAQMQLFAQHPCLDLVYCDGLHVGEGPRAGRTQMSLAPSRGEVTFRALLLEECKIFTSLTVVRKAAVLRAGLFDERYVRCEDYDLWLRMSYQGSKMMYQTRVLGRHRLRTESLAWVNTLMLRSGITVLTNLGQRLPFDPETRVLLDRQRTVFQSQLDREEGKKHLLAGDVREARELLLRANSVCPHKRLKLLLVGLTILPQFTVLGARLWNRRMAKTSQGHPKET